MAASMPSALPVLSNPLAASITNVVDHAAQHTNANDEIEAIAAVIGVTGSTVGTSLQKRVGDLEAVGLSSTAWTSYTPTWTGTTTNPAIGNGTIVAAYKQIGKTLFLRCTITMGSTTTYGSGAWLLTIPAGKTAAADQDVAVRYADSSSTTSYAGSFEIASGANTGAFVAHGSAGNVTASVPFAWTTSDKLRLITGPLEVS